MLLTNRLNFFDKLGNELNLLPDPGIEVTVIDPSNAGGHSAKFNVYTNRKGRIECLEIVDGGTNYDITGVAFLQFRNVLTGYAWNTDPVYLTIDLATGAILSFTGLAFPPGSGTWDAGNRGFPYPAVTWRGEMYFDRVSTGLIENQDLFILEKVITTTGAPTPDPIGPGTYVYHSYPRAEEGPLFDIEFYRNVKPVAQPNGTPLYGTGTVKVKVYSLTGNVAVLGNVIFGISSTTGLEVGMAIEGSGIAVGSTITEIINPASVRISTAFTATYASLSFTAYKLHGFVGGMKIKVGNSVAPSIFDSTYDVVGVSSTEIYFSTPPTLQNVPLTNVAASGEFFRAAPLWRGRVVGTEKEIFMFTIDYEADFPVINKASEVALPPLNVDSLSTPDTYFSGGLTINNANNDWQYREVAENIEERMMNFSLGFSADAEGSYFKLFVLEDITFPYAPVLITQVFLRGEAVGIDDRLGRLLQNFGREVTEEQELIMRNSDVFEDLPDFLLLNEKRKEMLLQGDEIWPYLGSYKGLVNIVNWFGYYDLRIKEYWLNVKEGDPYYGKYKQIQIPFQLQNRGTPHKSIDMVPSKVYKKTNKFGLFYDLNKESGVLDENGMPLTIDAFQFSNQEILIKLFALKQYLINNFLPLNTKIVDIAGEGVYYERYAANTWNDNVSQTVVDLTRQIDFRFNNYNEFIPIEDARKYDTSANAYVTEPGVNTLGSYYATYEIYGINITASAALQRIPSVYVTTLSGNASPTQQWNGAAFVQADFGNYNIGGGSDGGSGYTVGDIITLNGGVFANPIKIKVLSIGAGGDVINFNIAANFPQGSTYTQLPEAFSQLFVVSQDLVNNLYYAGSGSGLKLEYSNLNYLLQGIKTRTVGKGYPANDPLALIAIDPVTSVLSSPIYTFDTVLKEGPAVGYFSQGKQLIPLTNEPNTPVAAFLELEALGFSVAWQDLTFSWDDVWGAGEATVKAYVDALPAGTGGLVALEILSAGSGYTSTPSLQFTGGEGFGSTAQGKIKNGALSLLEFTASSIVGTSPTVSRIFFTFPLTPVPFAIGSMVTGADTAENEIPKPSIITNIDPGGTYVDITGSTFFTSVGTASIKIHAGAVVLSGGGGYVYPPDVKTTGGQTSTLYTWNEAGRGNFYEMEWRVESEPETVAFSYSSGRKTIDELEFHTVKLPYTGFYKTELVVYDSDNNYVNEIKRYFVKAILPEAAPGLVTRFIGPSYPPGDPVENDGKSDSNAKQLEQNCVDLWEEAFYQWDEYWGRWINPIKTWTTWDDCKIEWGSLEVTPLSRENNWSYPAVAEREVYRVSAYDNIIGRVDFFNPLTLKITIVGPTNANSRPPVGAGEAIYLRRDDLVFQLIVASTTYPAAPSVNVIEYVLVAGQSWPNNFESNPSTWEVLREVGGTIVVEDDLYTPGNGKTLVPGQYVTLEGTNNTPLNSTRWNLSQPPEHWGIPITAKSAAPSTQINLPSPLSSNALINNQWLNGEIYQYRNQSYVNGYLYVSTDSIASSPVSTAVYVENNPNPTEDGRDWGNLTNFYINDTIGSSAYSTSDPLQEVRGGFTEFTLVVAAPNTDVWFDDAANAYNTPAFAAPASYTRMLYRPNALSPAGTQIWSISSAGLTSHTTQPLAISATYAESPIASGAAAYSKGSDRIYLSKGTGNALAVFDCTSLTYGTSITIATGTVNSSIAYTDEASNLIYYSDGAGTTTIYYVECATGILYTAITLPANTLIEAIAYSPAQKRLYALEDTGTIHIIDANPYSILFNTVIVTVATAANAAFILTYVPGADAIVFPTGPNAVTRLNCSNNTLVASPSLGINTATFISATVHLADGMIWYTTSLSNSIVIYDFANNVVWTTTVFSFTGAGAGIVYNDYTNSVFALVNSGGNKVFEIFGKLFKDGDTLYQQHFRTINVHSDTSNQGLPWNLWQEPVGSKIIVVEAETIDGKKWPEIDQKMADLGVDGISVFAWIEYKYTVFPTRTYEQTSPPGTFANLLLDYNTHPVLGIFDDNTNFPANPYVGTGWFFDAGISEGNFSQKVINVGNFSETPGWTIITVEDPDSELYRCDSSFKLKARDFDEDFAETHLGVKLCWDEVKTLDWGSLCSQTWTTTDWKYNLGTNFRVDVVTGDANSTIRFNEFEPFTFNTAGMLYEDTIVYAVDLLNNNFYSSTNAIKPNDNPGMSLFYYDAHELVPSGNMASKFFSWGDPTIFKLFGNSTSAVVNDRVLAQHIQPGWRVSAIAGNDITLAAGPNALGTIPWIPACIIHATTVAGSRRLTSIVGYLETSPLGGWLWDNATSTVVGEFGPSVGPITKENGFVTSITMNAAYPTTVSNLCLHVYPKRGGLAKLLHIAAPAGSFSINAYSKNPGAHSLGYLRAKSGVVDFLPNSNPITNTTSFWNHSFPLGNYYKWVQDLDIFYGGGTDSSLLQFTQYYRNIQTYIYEGGTGRPYSADGGGWYPSLSWGSYGGFTDGGYAFADPVTLTNENLYKPVAKVSIYNEITGLPLIAPGAANTYILLDTWYDGFCQVWVEGSPITPADFTAFAGYPASNWPVSIKILVEDIDGDGVSQEFSAVIVSPEEGILGKSAFYIDADWSQNTSLVYDPGRYQISGVSTAIAYAADANTFASLSPGMVLGYQAASTMQLDFPYSTRIVELSSEGNVVYLDKPISLGSPSSGNTDQLYAYTPLYLNLKVQPVSNLLWSRTKQYDSMRLQYEDSMNAAFTWEDTTISIRERKIPAGSSVLFTSDPSTIAGKTKFSWGLYRDGIKVVSLTDPSFLWTFLEPGLYDVELQITDTNGNVQRRYCEHFVEAFLPA